jgi:hypothetical protein
VGEVDAVGLKRTVLVNELKRRGWEFFSFSFDLFFICFLSGVEKIRLTAATPHVKPLINDTAPTTTQP